MRLSNCSEMLYEMAARKTRGPRYPITREWRDLLIGWLANNPGKISGRKLALTIKTQSANITFITDGTTKASDLVPDICRATGLPMPEAETLDPRVSEGRALLAQTLSDDADVGDRMLQMMRDMAAGTRAARMVKQAAKDAPKAKR
jgi:hypothetical protein